MTSHARRMKRARERPARKLDEKALRDGIMRELRASAANGDRDAIKVLRLMESDRLDDFEARGRLVLWAGRQRDRGRLPAELVDAWGRLS